MVGEGGGVGDGREGGRRGDLLLRMEGLGRGRGCLGVWQSGKGEGAEESDVLNAAVHFVCRVLELWLYVL